MRRLSVISLVLLLLTISSAFAVEGQLDDNGRVMLHAGAFWPLSSDTKDVFGSTWLDVGVDVMVTRGEKIEHYASFGWLSGDNSSTEDLGEGIITNNDTEIDVFSICYTQRMIPRVGFYAGGSVGLFIVDTNVTSRSSSGVASFDGSDGVFGFKVIGGYEFSRNFRVEAAFSWIDEAEIFDFDGSNLKEDLSGLSFNLMARF